MPICRLLTSALAAILLNGACGPSTPERTHTGGVVKPASDDERRLLQRLEHLASEQPTRVGNVIVVAEPPYFAASGRTCRRLTLTTHGKNGHSRLACREGTTWFYVPEVFSLPTSGQ